MISGHWVLHTQGVQAHSCAYRRRLPRNDRTQGRLGTFEAQDDHNRRIDLVHCRVADRAGRHPHDFRVRGDHVVQNRIQIDDFGSALQASPRDAVAVVVVAQPDLRAATVSPPAYVTQAFRASHG